MQKIKRGPWGPEHSKPERRSDRPGHGGRVSYMSEPEIRSDRVSSDGQDGRVQVLDHSRGVLDGVLATLVGRRLGKGAYRHTYELVGRPDVVLKVEDNDSRRFCNQSEWVLWHEVAAYDKKLKPWLAPCVSIDAYGSAMVMRRTSPIEAWPQSVIDGGLPDVFNDIKLANFGMMDGRLVCHDYAFMAARLVQVAGCRRPYKELRMRPLAMALDQCYG